MSNIKLVTDGASDLTKEECQQKGIINIPFYVMKAGESNSREYSNDELYSEMQQNTNQIYKTACPSTGAYYEIFENIAKENNDIICVCITQEFSGSYNSACIASEMIKEEYPSTKITIIDSRMNTVLQGLYVLEIQKMIDKGINYEKIIKRSERLKENANIMFTVEDIKYLRNGGRIGALKSFLAQSFSIKPIINMVHGNIIQAGMSLGIVRTLKSILMKVKDFVSTHKDKKFKFSIGYSCNKILAIKLCDELKKLLHLKDEDVELRQIGVTSAVHTGPNTIGVAFIETSDSIA